MKVIIVVSSITTLQPHFYFSDSSIFSQLNWVIGSDCSNSESSSQILQQIKVWEPKCHPTDGLRIKHAILAYNYINKSLVGEAFYTKLSFIGVSHYFH